MNIEDLKKIPPNTLKIDWEAVENHIGFKLHENVKDFYSRIYCAENKRFIEGNMPLNLPELIKQTGNEAFDNWLSEAAGSETDKYTQYRLYLLNRADLENADDFFDNAFFGSWTGGNDLGHRAYIGWFSMDIGDITLLLNNDSGQFEWVDFSYGYFEVYEENPHGAVADDTQEFLNKFSDMSE